MPSRKEKLTKRTVDSASYGGSGSTIFMIKDTKVSGFGLRITPAGSKAYVIFYKNHFKQRKLMTIGSPSVLSVDQARQKAMTLLGENARGTDPLFARNEKARGEYFKDFQVDYIENYAKENKKSWKEDKRRIEKYLTPEIGTSKLKTIESNQIAKIHRQLKQTKSIYEANRTLALVSKIFNYAKSVKAVPADFINPSLGIKKFNETSRDRWLSTQELSRLNTALIEEPNIYIQKAFILLLLTGARKNELLTAKWEDVDWDRNELLLQNTKSGEAQKLYLNAASRAHLNELPMVEGNPYIFIGAKEGQHLVNIHKAWIRTIGRACLKNVRIHDLRRTLGSHLVQSGHSLKLIKEILRHKHSKTTEIYARISDQQKRDALELTVLVGEKHEQ